MLRRGLLGPGVLLVAAAADQRAGEHTGIGLDRDPVGVARLQAGLARLPDADLDEGQAGLLLRYVDLLVRWNRAYNLTAVREPGQMVTRHLLDSLAILPWVGDGPLLDAGTGAVRWETRVADNAVGDDVDRRRYRREGRGGLLARTWLSIQQHQAASEGRDGDRADDEESLHAGIILSELMGSGYS